MFECLYLLSGFRFSTAVCVWFVVTMDTSFPCGPLVLDSTSYSFQMTQNSHFNLSSIKNTHLDNVEVSFYKVAYILHRSSSDLNEERLKSPKLLVMILIGCVNSAIKSDSNYIIKLYFIDCSSWCSCVFWDYRLNSHVEQLIHSVSYMWLLSSFIFTLIHASNHSNKTLHLPVVSLSVLSQSMITKEGHPSTVTTVTLEGGVLGGPVTFKYPTSSSGK